VKIRFSNYTAERKTAKGDSDVSPGREELKSVPIPLPWNVEFVVISVVSRMKPSNDERMLQHQRPRL
jgi:hypothetical protein